MAQLTRRESVRNDATRRQGSCTKASRAAKPAPSAQAACVDNPAAAQAACARPSRRRRDSVSRARPPAVRAAVAAVLALALGAFGCAPAGSAGKAPEVQASDRSYVEERVPLPEGLPFVADLAIDETGALLVVAQDAQRTMAALCRQDADASWQRTKEVDAAAVAGQDASMPAVAMTPQGKLVGVVMPSDGTAAFLCTADGDSVRTAPLELADAGVPRLRCFDERSAFVMTADGGALRVDTATGQQRGAYALKAGERASDLAVVGGRACVVVSSAQGGEIVAGLAVVDQETGAREDAGSSLQQAFESVVSSGEAGAFVPPSVASDGETLFVCSQGRLFACTEEGEVTQMMTADGTQLANPGLLPARLAVPPEDAAEGFAILYSDPGQPQAPHAVCRYAEGEREEPSAKLVVYALQDCPEIQQAAATYRDVRPDVAVEVQVGIPAGSGLSADDALRALNASLLAGTGPDLLVLDGLPLDRLVGQGMLLDVADQVDAWAAEGNCFEGVLRSLGDGEGCYAVPTRMVVPVVAGNADAVGRAASLSDLAAYGGTGETRALLAPSLSLYALWVADYGAIVTQGHGVDAAALREFFRCAKDLTDATVDNLAASNGAAGAEANDYRNTLLERFGKPPASFALGEAQITGVRQMEVGCVGDTLDFGSLFLLSANAAYPCTYAALDFSGNRPFAARAVLGVSARGTQTDEATAFLSYVLSADAQMQGQGSGLPVNRQAFEDSLRRAEGGYQVSFGGGASSTYACDGLSSEDLDACAAFVESVQTPVVFDRAVSDAVFAGLESYCQGEATLDDAVASTVQKIDLYRAE